MTRFRVICADNPWRFDDTAGKRGAAANYDLLDLEAICALPVRQLAEPDALLALWVPNSMIADGCRVMSSWGFEQKQCWTWVKTAGGPSGLAFGMGRLGRNCTEQVLIGTRGSLRDHVGSRSERTAFLAPPMKHSEKPEVLQDMLDRLVPTGDRLELFARRARPGYACWGNESPETQGRDIRDVIAEHIQTRGAAPRYPPPATR